MNLIESNDIKAVGKLDRFAGRLGGSLVAKLVMYIMRLNKINKLYSDVYDEDPEAFLERLIDALGVTVEVNPEDLQKIPAEGAFITISNHPFGGLDGIILIKLLSKIRPDYKVMANFLLKKIIPIKDYFLGVNPFEGRKDISSAGGLKEALRHLSEGGALGLFPAGEVSAYQADSNSIEDKEWSPSVLKLIRKADVPVVPIYFKGSNSLLFQILGLIHPMLRTVKLPSELLNKKNRVTLFHRVIKRPHQLRGPGKSFSGGYAKLYNQKAALIGHSPVLPISCPAVSRRDSGHRRPVTA